MQYKKIFVAGGTGFLGSRVTKRLDELGWNYITTSKSKGVDFRNLKELDKYFAKEKPDVVINCAAYVGGIQFGLKHEGEIFFNNLLMSTNLMECARIRGVRKIINPLSNCSYPNVTNKTFKEEEWWDGPLHDSVMVYGFAKKATWMQAYAYSRQYGMNFTNFLVPNMYGPGDHFEEERSHALGALIMKIVKAKQKGEPQVTVWGSGKPVREWLYIDDCVEAFMRALEKDTPVEPINLGQGTGISIGDLAEKIRKKAGYQGKLVLDKTKPDGAPYKVMNVDKLRKIFGWTPSTSLDEGIEKTIEWYCNNKKRA
ncbi:MAG: NAD-dependent epimerase/dehydratase family protein [Candidatus Micrarchaeia archaeon]